MRPIKYDEDSEVSEMNISQLKAFLGDKPQHLGNENSLQNQLRDAGLKQAVAGQGNAGGLSVDRFSSSTSLGVSIYSNSFNSTLEVARQKPNFSVPTPSEDKSSLFDFEEVAKNVLNFVGGAIKNAQSKGADTEELESLFEQASSGVLKGIELAEQDLAGFLNDEIANGISKSKSLIEEGIANLKRDIFEPAGIALEGATQAEANSISVSYESQQSGELSIRTRDGDQVSISFADIQQFEFNQQQIRQNAEVEQLKPVDPEKIKDDSVQLPRDETKVSLPVANDAPEENAEQAQEVSSNTAVTEQNAIFYQESSFSFSVKGELDKDELKAIGQLVADANELAEEFFNGDIETAFNQALELGFDEQELSSFALQLTKVENTQVIKAYETVSRFDEENTDSDPAKAAKPIAEYLDKLLNVLDGSRLQLEDSKSYENVINELINRLGEDVATPDLISAVNRFNEFNQRLVNNLPIGYQPEA